jgi:hypothetical protein
LSRLTDSGAPGQDDASTKKMRELSTAMRTMHGQASTFIAQYKQNKR